MAQGSSISGIAAVHQSATGVRATFVPQCT
jgi:hypothetical protein